MVNDLADLKGIGPTYAEMLKSIGIDSIKELRHRNPANLKKMIEERHGRVVGLSEDECRTWIEEAAERPPDHLARSAWVNEPRWIHWRSVLRAQCGG